MVEKKKKPPWRYVGRCVPSSVLAADFASHDAVLGFLGANFARLDSSSSSRGETGCMYCCSQI